MGKRRVRRRSLASDTRASVMVEYVVVVAFAGILVAIAFARIGPGMVESYSTQRRALHQHAP